VARAVRWAGRAKTDLRAAVEYIKKENPASAGAFLARALETARSLAEHSERGRVVVELDDPEVRQLLVGRYRLLYEIQGDTIWVMRIVHGSRDLLLALGRRTREAAEE
jgi:plasmid stabilization system protein ParE